MIFKNILYIIIGLYFIISPLFFKVIWIRLPKDILDIPLIIIILSLSIYMYLIYKIILVLNSIKKKESFIQKYISIPLQELYYNSMIKIDNYIKHDILGPKYLGENLLLLVKFLNKYLTEKKCSIIFSLLDFLPRVVFLFCFFIDVIITQQLKYIYYLGFITIIPLIMRYLIYTIKSFILFNIKDYSTACLSFCDANYKEVSLEILLEGFLINSFNSNIAYTSTVKYITLKEPLEENEIFDEILDFYLDQFYVFSTMYNFINFFEHLKKHIYYQFFLLLSYICHFIFWLYILLIINL